MPRLHGPRFACALTLAALVLTACADRVADDKQRQIDRLTDTMACSNGDNNACARNIAANQGRCESGDTQGCVLLGIMHQVGRTIPKDEARAVKYFEQACTANDANGCWYLGTCFEMGHGVAKDPTRALAHYQKGCDLGTDVNACQAVGALYEHGRGVALDKQRALQAYDRACAMRGGNYVCESAKRLRSR